MPILKEQTSSSSAPSEYNQYEPTDYPNIVEHFPALASHAPVNILGDWKPRSYQLPVLAHLDKREQNLMAVTVWHRRCGKTACALKFTIKKMFERPGLYFHVFPTMNQGRKVIWNGIDGAGKRFLDYFPEGTVIKRDNHNMSVHVMTPNGESIYQIVGTDGPNIDRLRGTNPVGIVMDEYSEQNPKAWDILCSIPAENGGWVWFIFTPKGKNHSYRLYQSFCQQMQDADSKVYAQLLTVLDTKRADGRPVITPDAIEQMRKTGVTETYLAQEFYCDFDVANEGTFFGKQMELVYKEGRVLKLPPDPYVLVDTHWDLGVNDTNSIIFSQRPRPNVVNIIDYYAASDEGFAHYYKVLNDKGYSYGSHYAPWDIKQRVMGVQAETRLQIARRAGIKFKFPDKRLFKMDAVEMARNIFHKCYFDEEKCRDLLDGLNSYSKEWDEDRQVYKSQEKHDWASHPASAFMLLAQMERQGNTGETRTVAEEAIHNLDVV